VEKGKVQTQTASYIIPKKKRRENSLMGREQGKIFFGVLFLTRKARWLKERKKEREKTGEKKKPVSLKTGDET